MTISKCVSQRLREILFEKQITIYELCQISGLSKGTITSLLYNRYESVNMKTVFILLQTLSVPVLQFFDSHLFVDLNKIDLG